MYNNGSLKDKKTEYREKYKKERAAMLPELKADLDSRICAILNDTLVYRHCKQILVYASTAEEISTWEISQKAIEDGKKIFFPKCYGDHHMDFYAVKNIEELGVGKFNVLEPKAEEKYIPQSADICIVPGLTYDKFGFRLGYGKGYYDRFLAGFVGAKVGLCYSNFIETHVPKGRYDVKIDVLITEKGVYPLQRSKQI